MSAVNYWPCPNNCMGWVRCFNPSEPTTNHHPNCEHVDKSLIEVFSVRVPGSEHGCIVDDRQCAERMANEDADAILEIVPMKMHKEIYEHLPEFSGF